MIALVQAVVQVKIKSSVINLPHGRLNLPHGLSVYLIYRPLQQRAVGLLLSALRVGDTN